MIRSWRAATTFAALILMSSTGAGAAEDSTSAEVPHFGNWGFDLTARDLTVKPGTDFFLYADGDWLKRTRIPADKTSYGNFARLDDVSKAAVRKLIEDAAAGRSSDHDAAKIGAAYKAYLDEARAEELDAKPLAADLAAIRAEKNKADVAALMGTDVSGFQQSIFGLEITPDAKVPTRYAVYLGADGLGLPDRDYYLKAQFADKKAKYQSYVASILTMIGWPDPDGNAKAVVDLETKFAEARWTRVEERDPDKQYHPMTVAELAHFAPGFDFRLFLDKAELGPVDQVVVTTDTAFPKFAAIFDQTSLDTLQAWQAFHLGTGAAPYLSKRFVDTRFEFYGKTLSGQAEITPRWKRGVDFVNGALGESIGRMYVAEYFPPAAKAKIDELVKQVIAAMHARIDRLAWMSPATKQKAQQKLDKLAVKIGYPAKWRSYDPMTIAADDLYGNAARSVAYQWNYVVERLNKPVDKEEWQATPQEVNAGYDPLHNDITFPAAILQPPFFDPTADMAINYGGIGGVIGHEITHGFDDQGRKFDGDGMLTEWWTPQDAAKFEVQADRLAAQFDKFAPIEGNFVNGQLTLGENIADMGGLLLALDAYHAALNGKEAPVLDGLTGDQRVFLGWAQVWQEKVRDDAALMLLKADVHAPPQFRVNGPMRNIAAWYKAFEIGTGDPLYIAPEKRVSIW